MSAAGCAAVAAAIFFLMPSESATSLGGNSRSWVSGVGDDANPCSRTAPCKTFPGAISKTTENGSINCVDNGAFGTVTITKSITIDCHELYAGVLAAGTNGIVINFDAFNAADTARTVRLRNLNINGLTTGLNGIRIIGAGTGSEVMIEDTTIENFSSGGPSQGIIDQRSGGGELNVSNTTIRNIGGASASGIRISSGGANRIHATLDAVHVENGDAFGLLTKTGANAMVTNSVFSGNGSGGIEAENDAVIQVEHSVSSDNAFGLRATSPGTIRIADNDITFNNQGLAGTIESFGTNRIAGNATAGSAPTPIGAVSEAHGQQ